MKDISDRPITAEQYIHTMDNYNKLVEKVLEMEKEIQPITLVRKIRYVIYEILANVFAVDFLIRILFGQSVFTIFRNIYSYILTLF